ncbi:precorrin-6y C5,15-methyltransferase (decarboxylating) subunit CbiE [Desulfamplus magnetovallimortis]|uniref:precorrin-6y C5,15-methyltransferase (decarboxylating) subunit CbiE n=1 Tax=Desulfamplus magnetovallimortis TaxID=1246637 RepID=UPI001644266C|nr:precorrin-6y C5,15-methyltransferase (decarboxylating) subunit CbiE [Desulfamplus magnetovallimortis]
MILEKHCGSIDVIGVGLSFGDLTEKHKKIIACADLVVGGKRHLQQTMESGVLKGVPCETLTITGDINSIINTIRDRKEHSRIVVLASGDPLFNGIGSTLITVFGKESVQIHPNISSIAGAFAAIKEPWHDATLLSLHGKDIDNLAEILKKNLKIAILTDNKKTPSWLAAFLVDENIFHFNMYVLENLGTQKQQIYFFDDVSVVEGKNFASPNVVVLMAMKSFKPDSMGGEKKYKPLNNLESVMPDGVNNQIAKNDHDKPFLPSKPSCPENLTIPDNENHLGGQGKVLQPPLIFSGMPESMFFHENGLITKPEVRAVVLSKLELINDNHLFWDLGAGSGSVSVEVSRFIPAGKLYAVEKNIRRISDIRQNIEKFGIENIHVLQMELPCGMSDLPEPDRVFIGGGGRNIDDIVRIAGERLALNGVMVVNTVLLQSMNMAFDVMKNMGFDTSLIQMHVSVSRKMPFGERLEAQNPVWIISGKRI